MIGVHNSGWKQTPGVELVHLIHEQKASEEEFRLKEFVQGVLTEFAEDQRILMWDIYNDPGPIWCRGTVINPFKKYREVGSRSQTFSTPYLLSRWRCGEEIINLNQENSDVITFHCYEGSKLEQIIKTLLDLDRPIICTEYMAREFGTNFEFSLPIFKNYGVGCYNWGLVAGKSQTHFGWSTIAKLQKIKKEGKFLNSGDPIPEPEEWFHDILRIDGSPYDEAEVSFIRKITEQT
ncbi:MAG: hypothetical protein Ct9H300mP20_02680 [Gammaproteobacteria bacterium]|nr:MAG: hypothetical protein Ct9H300mP20_02680 [Gammaproteobacteria bacterium]